RWIVTVCNGGCLDLFRTGAAIGPERSDYSVKDIQADVIAVAVCVRLFVEAARAVPAVAIIVIVMRFFAPETSRAVRYTVLRLIRLRGGDFCVRLESLPAISGTGV